MVSPIPAGHNAVSPYLVVADPLRLIGFLEKVFGAQRLVVDAMPGGGTHAEVRIADSIVMIGGGRAASPGMVHVYVPDVDACFERALAAGATAMRKPETMSYGDRISMVKDADGNVWAISTHVEDVATPK